MDKTIHLTIRSLQKIQIRYKHKNRLKVKEWKNAFHTNNNQKRRGMDMLISGKIVFKSKTLQGKEGFYILIKCSI